VTGLTDVAPHRHNHRMTYAEVKRQLRRAYDAKAADREVMDDRAWKQPERERFAALLRAAGAGTLLEIGAGHGVSGRFFADEGFDVVCVDLSPELVERCRAKGLTAEVQDFSDLRFADGSFEAVFGMNCLLHVPRAELAAVLRSVRRVLAPGGLFYWGQYGGRRSFEGIFEHDDYEPKRFFSWLTDEEIQRAAGEVFEVADFRRIPLDGDRWTYQALVLRRP
jgi:SAM-dependent methyltransferase